MRAPGRARSAGANRDHLVALEQCLPEHCVLVMSPARHIGTTNGLTGRWHVRIQCVGQVVASDDYKSDW